MRNLTLFGYGVKSFTLSMIETAIELSHGRVTASDDPSDHRRRTCPCSSIPSSSSAGAEDAIAPVSETHRVMLITKGDLFDQESKLARSGLGEQFDAVEIVATKDERAYGRILRRHAVDAVAFRHDRQLAPVGHRAGARPRRLGDPRAAPADVGARAHRRRASR